MLSEKILGQISDRIDKINTKLRNEAVNDLNSGKKTKEVLNQLTKHAVREFTPESKMFLDSVYNVLSAETLQTEFFQVTAHAVEFNKRNIQQDIESRFSFDVPDEIDYEEKWKELMATGVILVVGGGVVLCPKSPTPVQIAAVFIVIMHLVWKNNKKKAQGTRKAKRNKYEIIDEYLFTVKKALIQWIKDVAEYYDNQVADLKKGISRADA